MLLYCVLEKTLESAFDSKEIKPVSCKGNQPWIFVGRTDAKAEAPVLWPPDSKNWLIGGEEDDRGWDGWMASLTEWTWVWANSRGWWETGKSDGIAKSQTWLRDWTANGHLVYHILAHGIWKDGTDELACRAVIEMQTQRTDLWTRVGEKREKIIWMDRVAWKHIH